MTPEEREANKYLSLMRNTNKRRYGQAYLAWLKNGCYGPEPDRGPISLMAEQAVRLEVNRILGPAPFDVLRPDLAQAFAADMEKLRRIQDGR